MLYSTVLSRRTRRARMSALIIEAASVVLGFVAIVAIAAAFGVL